MTALGGGGGWYASVLFGLASAFSFGIGDLCARTSGRRIGTFRAMFYGGLQGFLVLSVWLALGHAAWPSASSVAWGAAIVAGCLNLGATFALFRAFARGKLSLVVPVIASYSAVTVILSLLSGEPITSLRAAGVVFAIGGVVLACTVPAGEPAGGAGSESWRLAPGLGSALIAALGYGTTFWVLGSYAIPELGSLVPVWIYYTAEIVVLLLVALLARISLKVPELRQAPVVLGNGLCIVAAYICFSLGLGSASVAIVTVLSSLSGAVTVLGAALLLGERLVMRQWAGAAVILLGLFLINAGS